MSEGLHIDVAPVSRVEGHGNIRVRVSDGAITRLAMEIVESPRYFESFLRGKPYADVPHIACRICGICSIGHTTAALKGIEAAAGIRVSRQTILLRQLALLGEFIQSHVLHLYFLAIPDYLGIESVIPLAGTHPSVVRRALRMKKLANDVCAAVAGRHIHPIAMQVGGFSHLPAESELLDLRGRLEAARPDLEETIALFCTLSVPELTRETEYVSLRTVRGDDYGLYDGEIVSTCSCAATSTADYRARVIEGVVEHSTSKHCRSPWSDSYAVGALARFNNNHDRLHDAARVAATSLRLSPGCRNPFQNNTAQLVELVHCAEGAIELIDALLQEPPAPESPAQPTRFGRGVGAVEAPRGLLFHEYVIDSRGRVEDVNIIAPTGQNLANMEADMRALVQALLAQGADRDQITQRLEMLVRAYDPCISCAAHFLEVDWDV